MEEGVQTVSHLDSEKEAARQRSLSNLIPVRPGEVRNPEGGRATKHDLAKFIREQTLQGTKLAEFLISVVNGKDSLFIRMADRLKAVELLLNRGWGQAPQVITLQDGPNKPIFDLSKLSDEKFQSAKKLLEILSETVAEPEKAETASQEPPGTTISPPSDPQQAGK